MPPLVAPLNQGSVSYCLPVIYISVKIMELYLTPGSQRLLFLVFNVLQLKSVVNSSLYNRRKATLHLFEVIS